MTEKRHYYEHCLDALVAYRAEKEVWVESVLDWDYNDNPVYRDPFPIEYLDMDYVQDDRGGCLIDFLKQDDESTRFYSVPEEAT